jgi:DNA-binding beta-propeller fold protein YncE
MKRTIVRAMLSGVALVVVMALMAACGRARSATVTLLEPPGRDARARIDGDTAILINGRRVTPVGRIVRTQSYAWGLAIAPDGSRAAVLNKDAFELVDLREPYTVRRVPPLQRRTPSDERSAANAERRTSNDERRTDSYMGCAFSPDGARFYYGSANDGQIVVLDLASTTVAASIDLNVGGFEDSFPGDVVLSRDGRRLFVVDQFNYRLVTVDIESRKVVQCPRRAQSVRGGAVAR